MKSHILNLLIINKVCWIIKYTYAKTKMMKYKLK